jgi:predicted SAM-dependent methyltransferase
MTGTYLHLGCGDKKFDGFVNIDLDAAGADMHLDLTQPLPWDQGSVSGIYSEHFIEHITQAQGIGLLMECRRVLRPGGIVRIATPDLAEVINHYQENYVHPDWKTFDMEWVANRCERFNISMRWWGHQWVYDEEELRRAGEMVGLKVRERCKYGESADPVLSNREYRESSKLILEFEKLDRQLEPHASPLVSIVVPAFNPRYFQIALESAIAQTYKNIEIVVCDDCPSDAIEAIVGRYAAEDSRIRYKRNPDAGTDVGRTNHRLCFSEAKGEFIKFLNDDDMLAPTCVERMVACFAEHPDITLVTSKRQRINKDGEFLPDDGATKSPVADDAIIDGLSLGSALLNSGVNFVGEPTTVMFRKSELVDVRPDFMSIDGREISWVSDVAIYMNLAVRGNAIYLVEPLSYFRIHDEQGQIVSAAQSKVESKEGLQILRNFWERKGLF